MPFDGSVAVMVALGIMAPVESCTDPKIVPEVTCARRTAEKPQAPAKTRSRQSACRRKRNGIDFFTRGVLQFLGWFLGFGS
jgi:hypothetical protein